MPNPTLSCPWSAFAPGTLTYCEVSQCAWIVQPANSWSNLAYLLVGALVLHRRSESSEAPVRMIGALALAVGLASFCYHSSFTFIGEALDLGAMYLFSNLILVLNLRRLGALSSRGWLPIYLSLNAFSIAVFVGSPLAGFVLFGLQVAAGVGLELLLARDERSRPSRRSYFLALGIFLISYLFWNLDFYRVACDPNNHLLQGHAAWHILNSSVFFLLFKHYSQFDFQTDTSLAPRPLLQFFYKRGRRLPLQGDGPSDPSVRNSRLP